MEPHPLSLNPPVTPAANPAPPEAAAQPPQDAFQALLTTMLLGMLQAGSQASASEGPLGSLGGGLMAPLVLALMEGLTSQQVSSPTPHGLPLQGRLTQGAHPGHTALDLAVPQGTPVQSTMDGRVVFAGWNAQGYGNLVIVENGPYRTYYAHLSQIPVAPGQQVQAGQVVGLSGNTGNSTGPHLHYEVRLNGRPIDPTSFTLGTAAPGAAPPRRG